MVHRSLNTIHLQQQGTTAITGGDLPLCASRAGPFSSRWLGPGDGNERLVHLLRHPDTVDLGQRLHGTGCYGIRTRSTGRHLRRLSVCVSVRSWTERIAVACCVDERGGAAREVCAFKSKAPHVSSGAPAGRRSVSVPGLFRRWSGLNVGGGQKESQ